MKHLHRLPLCILLASSFALTQSIACGDDEGDTGGDDGPTTGADDGPSNDDADDDFGFDDDDGDDGQDNGDDGAQSECDSINDCDSVVCDCPDGPVNWTYCGIVNDIGRCGTEETCVEDGACD